MDYIYLSFGDIRKFNENKTPILDS